jgi:hypothetical protein
MKTKLLKAKNIKTKTKLAKIQKNILYKGIRPKNTAHEGKNKNDTHFF